MPLVDEVLPSPASKVLTALVDLDNNISALPNSQLTSDLIAQLLGRLCRRPPTRTEYTVLLEYATLHHLRQNNELPPPGERSITLTLLANTTLQHFYRHFSLAFGPLEDWLQPVEDAPANLSPYANPIGQASSLQKPVTIVLNTYLSTYGTTIFESTITALECLRWSPEIIMTLRQTKQPTLKQLMKVVEVLHLLQTAALASKAKLREVSPWDKDSETKQEHFRIAVLSDLPCRSLKPVFIHLTLATSFRDFREIVQELQLIRHFVIHRNPDLAACLLTPDEMASDSRGHNKYWDGVRHEDADKLERDWVMSGCKWFGADDDWEVTGLGRAKESDLQKDPNATASPGPQGDCKTTIDMPSNSAAFSPEVSGKSIQESEWESQVVDFRPIDTEGRVRESQRDWRAINTEEDWDSLKNLLVRPGAGSGSGKVTAYMRHASSVARMAIIDGCRSKRALKFAEDQSEDLSIWKTFNFWDDEDRKQCKDDLDRVVDSVFGCGGC